MGFSEMSSGGEWIEPTDDTIWQFADAMDISRFETYGLTAAVLFRLDVLRRNCDAFGIHSERSASSPPAPAAGCSCMAANSCIALRLTETWNRRESGFTNAVSTYRRAGRLVFRGGIFPAIGFPCSSDRDLRGHRLFRHGNYFRSASLNSSCN